MKVFEQATRKSKNKNQKRRKCAWISEARGKKLCRLFWFLVSSSSPHLFQVQQENAGRQYLTWFPFLGWYNRAKTGQHYGSKLGAVLHVWFVVIQRIAGQNTPPGKHNQSFYCTQLDRTRNWQLVKIQESGGSLCEILRIIWVYLGEFTYFKASGRGGSSLDFRRCLVSGLCSSLRRSGEERRLVFRKAAGNRAKEWKGFKAGVRGWGG